MEKQMSEKIGVQLTPSEIQVIHRALSYYIGDWTGEYTEVETKLLKELETVFKRIVIMEEA
jgi:hypothetical protein